ncbi:RHS repeat-associated core domain-containing protein [Streptomyces sp. SP18CS02]|uniref:RHS repeat-associated core domain-containing protein n=1 Tax=Streptomyces sp. SP18CS02 TaxID=3002531 RepID=UPI002E7658E8|nr:RHS repeat-associated core domain-containing protein [Streptomyces sp. SP18CS02]MEE1756765.1 DUF6531 domain-containing protein [Streptomyces sp. SP18CS02]
MAVTLPDWADTLLDVVGVNWPNVDEDAYQDMADTLREFADDLEDDGQLANNHVQRLLSSGHGEALDALNEHWGKVKGKHIKDIASAARTIAGALDLAVTAIETMKTKAVVELGILAGQTGLALALIPVTGGLSALLGAGAVAFTKKTLLRLITEAMEEAVAHIVTAMTEPAVAALENLAADLVVQLGATAMGLQDGVDVDQAAQAGKDGFKEGVQTSKDSMHLASAGTGAGGGGGGKGGGKGFHIEHAEHDHAGTQLNGVSIAIHGKTTGKLTRAKSHQGRNKGRDEIADALDPVIEKAMAALVKSTRTMGDHVGKTLPKAVKQISKDHKDNDDDIRARLAKENKKDDDGHGGNRGGGPQSRGKGPDGLSGARNNTRLNSVALSNTTCVGDPVDVATGEVLLPQTDLQLPGTLPWALRRTHLSEYRYGQWFGRSWASTLDERVELDLSGGAVWAREDGSLLVYPALPTAARPEVSPVEGHDLRLARHQAPDGELEFSVTDPATGLTRRFSPAHPHETLRYWLWAVEDRSGNRVEIVRAADGMPVSVVHTGGYEVTVTGDREKGRVTGIALRTPDGSVPVAGYGHDEQGHLTEVVNSSGLPLRFTYDPEGRITSWTDRNGSAYRYEYDGQGRAARTVGPDGILTASFRYDTEARRTHFTDSTGATRVFQLNERYQIVAETDPHGHTVHRSWDRRDNLLARTDALGHTLRIHYDDAANPVTVSHPDGLVSTAVYNALGLPTELTGRDGSVWRQTFDERGHRTAFTDPSGATTRYARDASGHLTGVVDALGQETRIRCDRAGLPVEFTDPAGAVTRFVRDAFGRPVEITGPLGAVTRLTWSTEDRLLRRTGPDGGEESWAYDGEGNCVRHTDATGATTRFEYTHFDLLAARVAPDGTRHTFTHDTELRLTEVTNPQGLTWRYTYDAVGDLISETDFDRRVLGYSYDATGRLAARTGPLGDTTRYERSPLGHVVRKDAAGAVTTYAYDPSGRLVRATGPDSEASWEHDVLGRVVSETVDGRTLTHAYDALGRRVRRTTPTGAVSTFAYDSAGNRTALSSCGHGITFEHDPAGRELARHFGENLSLAHTFDDLGRLTGQHLTAGERTVRRRAYTFRADGLLAQVRDEHAGTRSFGLDPAGRVTAVSADGWSESYAYDDAGNQTSAEWPAAHAGAEATGPREYSGTRVTSAGRVRYAYDAAGRTVLRRAKRLSGGFDSWAYTWDAEDRLTAVTTPDGTVWRYRYDPLGRRSAKQRLDADGRVREQVDFTWDGTTLCEQTTRAPGVAHPVSLTWDHDGLRPLAQTERILSADAAQEEIDRRFFAIVTDLSGAPTELVDQDGGIAWRARTTVWGTTTWPRGTTAYTPLRFPGQYYDPETGLHYNYFRHYDPATARYLSPDPLGLAAAPNPVAYVHNPLTWADPLGLAPYEVFYRVMGAKEFKKLGPNGEITPRGENFVTQEKEYVVGIAERTTRKGGRNADKYTHFVRYEMEPGTRDALIGNGRGSGDNKDAIKEEFGIDLDEIGDSDKFVHVKMERGGLNFGLRAESADVFNSRIKGMSHKPLPLDE